MCSPGSVTGPPGSVTGPPGSVTGLITASGAAVAAVEAGLAWLATADAAGLTADEQATCLRALERAEARLTAARASVLAAFTAARGFEADGQGGPQSWLAWQTRITRAAAAGATAWMRRLAAHPAIAGALASAEISVSWARQVSEWTDQLPAEHRAGADQILLGAAVGGAGIRDLADLAEEIRRRTARPDTDSDDGFADRSLRLDRHYRGAGKLDADLTPPCAAALQAVLDALGRKAGPEDTRTQRQRDHDALEEACRRLIAAGDIPDRAGQPTQIQLHMTLDELRGLPGAADAENAWTAARSAGDGEPGWATSRETAQAYACDAQITPIVTGHVDPAILASLTSQWLAGLTQPGSASCPPGTDLPATGPPGTDLPATGPPGTGPPGTGDAASGTPLLPPRMLPPRTLARLQDTLLRYAADVLSGPRGLTAFLRTRTLAAEFPSVSLPLDVGTVASTVPPHLRRAVISRDRRCAFPGCAQRPSSCQVHHIQPRAAGGTTCLTNLLLLCPFHHLIAIHRWGWSITLHGNGTTTATSPDGRKTLRSHSPPSTGAV